MITTIITILLSVIGTCALAMLANRCLYTDFIRIATIFKITKLPFVTIGKTSINLLLDDGEVIEFKFDEKGKLLSNLLLK